MQEHDNEKQPMKPEDLVLIQQHVDQSRELFNNLARFSDDTQDTDSSSLSTKDLKMMDVELKRVLAIFDKYHFFL